LKRRSRRTHERGATSIPPVAGTITSSAPLLKILPKVYNLNTEFNQKKKFENPMIRLNSACFFQEDDDISFGPVTGFLSRTAD
jgi:hypothetical protein